MLVQRLRRWPSIDSTMGNCGKKILLGVDKNVKNLGVFHISGLKPASKDLSGSYFVGIKFGDNSIALICKTTKIK